MKLLKNSAARASLATALLAAATSARAEIDTAPITGALTEAGTAAAVVGSAVLVVVVGIKAFKMIRTAM